MRKLRISASLSLHPRVEGDIAEDIRCGLAFLKKTGFDAADFPMWLIDFSGDFWEEHISKTLKACKETEMNFEICHLPFHNPEDFPSFCVKMHNAIDAAAMLGVEYAVLHPNTTTLPMSEFDEAEQYDAVMRQLAPFAEHAEKVNVKLALENMRLVPAHFPVHRYCQAPEELCRVADALGIGVCWDFGHANIAGLTQSEALAYIGSRLKVIHVNDNKGVGDDHIAPFMGTIDWADAMKGLSQIGFNGLFNFEVLCENVPAHLREKVAGYLVGCAGELMKY